MSEKNPGSEGLRGKLNRLRDGAGNFAHDPNVRQELAGIGGAALAGALDTVRTKDGEKISKWKLARAALNPTGALTRAARGAVSGARAETGDTAGIARNAVMDAFNVSPNQPAMPWETQSSGYQDLFESSAPTTQPATERMPWEAAPSTSAPRPNAAPPAPASYQPPF